MFKLMLISPKIDDLSKVTCFTDVWSYYLPRALQRYGVQIIYEEPLPEGRPNAELYYGTLRMDSDIDHVLALGLRYFSLHPIGAFHVLQKRVDHNHGRVAQFYDGPIDSNPVWSLCCRDTPDWRRLKNYYVGWAADPVLCSPYQDHDTLRILIDHPHYEGKDFSEGIWKQVAEFVRSNIWKQRFKKVRVRVTVDGGFEDWDCEHINVQQFHRRHIPFQVACAEYSLSHIFIPTHQESLGQVVLETAMAGALPVVRSDFIYADRLSTVRHYLYDSHIDWQFVLDNVDVDASRTVALPNNWGTTAWSVINFFKGDWRC
jgi:hypothetical protein